MISSPDARPAFRLGRLCSAVALAASLAMLAGCLDKQKGEADSQTAAKVNSGEITVHQIDFVLQQQRGLKPEQAAAASKQILERLIDQELAVQKATELQLDRDPRVVRLLEAARREIVARAYAEKTSEAAAKPSDADIKAYYDAHPALFSARRIYTLQELSIEASPEQGTALREQLAAAQNVGEFVEYLKANSYRYSGNQAVRTAEQLPLNMLESFAKLNDGHAILVPAANGVQVIVLVGSRSEPVDEARAKPVIEQFLMNDAKRKLFEADIKALRSAAKIEYIGKFASAAASAAAASPAAPEQGGSAVIDSSSLGKGLGLK